MTILKCPRWPRRFETVRKSRDHIEALREGGRWS
jgi:hypothetical protein